MESKPILLITGINGFACSWILKKALESGKYSVRGTVRDKNNQKKLQPLRDALGDLYDELEVVSADLNDKEALARAVEGCTYIIHTASPVILKSPKNEDEVIKPAVNGNLYILEACVGSTVKKVVITSSIATIQDHSRGDIEVDETNVIEIDKHMTPYYKSKIFAEREAIKFMKSLPRKDQTFEVWFILPGLVMGPLLWKGTGSTIDIISQMLTGKFPPIPDVYFTTVDIRDLADAHFAALEKGKNCELYAACDKTFSLQDLGLMIYNEYKPKGYKPRRSKMAKCLCWIGSLIDKDAKAFYEQWGVRCHVSNRKSIRELGVSYTNSETAIFEMCDSLIKLGIVPDKTKKK